MWLYINLNLYYNIIQPVPLELKLSKSQALGNELPSNINVTLRGKGWELLGVLLSGSPVYELDLTGYKKDSKINLTQSMHDILGLPTGVSILNVSPDMIDVNFDNVTTKYVKVKNNVQVFTKDGYFVVDNPVISPDSIKITGAMSIIGKIKYLPTEPLIIKNANSSFTKYVRILDTLSNIVKIDPKSVTITYNVELSAEKTLDELDVNVLNVPADKTVLIIPPKISVYLRGGVDQLAKLNPEDIIVSVDFNQIEKDSSDFVIPKISKPVDISIVKFQPDKFQYIIKTKKSQN